MATIGAHIPIVRDALTWWVHGPPHEPTTIKRGSSVRNQEAEMNPNRLDLKRKLPLVDYADRDLTSPFSCDSRYMTSLLVIRKNKPYLEVGAANIDSNHQRIQDKIEAALKLLTFREQHVLVQFWWLCEVGKQQLLETIDQPFGVGVLDAGLSLYRRDSEGRSFTVDMDNEDEDRSPAARVFRRGLPEWTSDVFNYTPKHFPQQECAIRCNLHGYLALPVFNSNTQLCVGVLELLTSSKYTSYAYEVQQLQHALETVDLITPQAFRCPTSKVPDEYRHKDLQIIHGILKTACDIHKLPLAQTWAVSEHGSFVSHEKVIQKSCSSFDTSCVGKVCLSRAGLPFHVQDLGKWPFYEACRERHLDRSSGPVGKALLTCGSCFCGDVTKLSEEEYPLVHNAHMYRLTSCFAIFLHSVEANDDYVLEFFLPPDIKDSGQVLNLVQTLKQKIGMASGFELGDSSCIQEVPTDLSVNMKPDVIQTSWDSVADNFTSSDTESSMAIGSINFTDQWSPTNMETCFTSTDTGERSNPLNQGKKHKIDSDAIQSFTWMVTAKVTFNEHTKSFHVPISSGLSFLENQVAQSFKLKGKEPSLKYIDEDNDLIRIACDADLKYAVVTAGSNNSINLICVLPTVTIAST